MVDMNGWMFFLSVTSAALLVDVPCRGEVSDDTLASAKDGGQSSPTELRRSLLEAHNRERMKLNLSPLTLDSELTAAAQQHSDDMAAHGKLAHEGSDGSTPSERIRKQGYRYQNDGENVAEAYRTVDDVMRGWMGSEHHRDNILGRYSQVGFALARDDQGKPYWTAVFATPWPQLDPVRATADLVKALDSERASADLPRLKVSEKLNGAAFRIAKGYADSNSLDPRKRGEDLVSLLERLDYKYSKLAESAASGQPNVEDVIKTWMASHSHREQILSDFTEIGAGYALSRSGPPYWFVILARPR